MDRRQDAVSILKKPFIPLSVARPTTPAASTSSLYPRHAANATSHLQRHRSTTPQVDVLAAAHSSKQNHHLDRVKGKGKARDSGVGMEDDAMGQDESGSDDGDCIVVEEQERVVWTVQYRIPQHRKNKTWEHDGWLIIKGGQAILRDEHGKIMSTGPFSEILAAQQEFRLGGKECILDEPSTFEDYQASCSIVGSPEVVIIRPQAPRPSVSKLVLPTSRAQPQSNHRLPLQENSPPKKKQKLQLTREDSVVFDDDNNHVSLHSHPHLESKTMEAKHSTSSTKGQLFRSSSPAQSPPRQRQASAAIHHLTTGRATTHIAELDDDVFGADEVDMEEIFAEVDRLASSVEVMPPPPPPIRATLALVAPKKQLLGIEMIGRPRSGLSLPGLKGVMMQEKTIESVYYTCFWKTRNQKKSSSWEGDGVLVVTGKGCILKDQATGRSLANDKISKDSFEPEDEVHVGSKVVQIAALLDPNLYRDGSIFGKSTYLPIPSTSFFKLAALPVPVKFKDPCFGGHIANRSTQKEAFPRFDPTVEGAAVMMRPDKAHELKHNTKQLAVVDVVIDPYISRKLRTHQIEGVKFMYECVMGMRSEGQGCILADEMGLGKTAQAIALIWTLLKQSPYFGHGTTISRAMVVCPVTLVKNWSAEFKKWLGRDRIGVLVMDGTNDVKTFCLNKSYQVLVIGYEKLLTVLDQIKAVQPPIGLVICDEGHRLKSAKANVSRLLKSLPTNRRIILSGTPIQNDLSEFHSMVDFVNPGSFDTYTTFKKVFESVIVKSREPKASRVNRDLGTKRSEQLSRVAKKFVLRRTADVMAKFLPPKLEYVVFTVPTKLQRDMYQQILKSRAANDILNGQGAQQLILLSTLQKLCNSPGLVYKTAKQGKATDIITPAVLAFLPPDFNPNDFALSGKLLAFGALLKDLHESNEEKIIVVSNFTATLDIIEAHCKSKRYAYCRLDGSTSPAERMPIVNSFNNGPLKNNFIFLLSSKSGGTGLNLIGASRLVLLDSDWNPSIDLQAMARIHRDGQKRTCVIYRFLTTGTLDEKIYQRQITKLGLSHSLMDEGGPAIAGAAKANAFTTSELRTVFQLHTGLACQTHELLACQCHQEDYDPEAARAAQDALDALPDESSSPSRDGFLTASQFNLSSPDVVDKDRQKLSLLREWTHHNCNDFDEIDKIEDALLRDVTFALMSGSDEDVDGATAEEGVMAEDQTKGMSGLRYHGGAISFAFAKKSTSIATARVEEL